MALIKMKPMKRILGWLAAAAALLHASDVSKAEEMAAAPAAAQANCPPAVCCDACPEPACRLSFRVNALFLHRPTRPVM